MEKFDLMHLKKSISVHIMLNAILFPTFFFLSHSCGSEDSSTENTTTPLPEYTKENAREWESIKDEHIPKVTIARDGLNRNLKIRVPLSKPSPSHYIEVIGVMDENKTTLKSVKFDRNQKVFTVDIPIENNWDLSNIKVYAKCNLHDTWTVDNLHELK